MNRVYESDVKSDHTRSIVAAVIVVLMVMMVFFGVKIGKVSGTEAAQAVAASEPILDENWSEDTYAITADAKNKADQALAAAEDATAAADNISIDY